MFLHHQFYWSARHLSLIHICVDVRGVFLVLVSDGSAELCRKIFVRCRQRERHGRCVDFLSLDVYKRQKQHGVDKVFLFGSYARGDATPASDVDLCVDAPRLRGLFALGGLYADLEDALKKSIDVVTTGSLKYNKDKAFLENLRKDRVLLYELS